MAANKVEKGGVRKSTGLRTSLTIPYTLTWPVMERKTYFHIMNAIGRQFPTVLSQKTISKRKKKELESLTVPPIDEDKILMEQIEEKNSLRKCFVTGINEVTKGLEKDQLALVLVDRSVKPTTMTDHLMLLGATRQTPTVGLHELTQLIGPLLHYKKVAALGFKKERPSPCFDALIKYITDKAPDIVIPWLKPFAERNIETSIDLSSKQDDNIMGQNETRKNNDVESEGLKRKLEDKLESEDNNICPASKLIKLEASLTEEGVIKSDSSPLPKTGIGQQNEKECNETAKGHSSNKTDITSNSFKKNKTKLNKEKIQNPDFEITTVSYQRPNIKTVEKGQKEKKNKKKKKKQKK